MDKFIRLPLSEKADARFHRALGKFIDEYGWFDYNLGLQLNYWGKLRGVDIKAFLRSQASLKDRLDRVQLMIKTSLNPVTELEHSQYRDWIAGVESIRGLRNDYAHGRWAPTGNADGEDPEMMFVPLQWNAGSEAQKQTVSMRLSELERQAGKISELINRMGKVLAPYLEFRQRQDF